MRSSAVRSRSFNEEDGSKRATLPPMLSDSDEDLLQKFKIAKSMRNMQNR